MNLPSRTQQRIKFDITDDEVIVDSADVREVFHLYSDAPSPSGKVRCYSVNEILAEKTRAIYERQGRARDIYDIVNISRNFREHVDINVARAGLKKKFDFKSLPHPSVDLILSQLDFAQLKAGWEDQLGHQLEVLPLVENFYYDLKPALSWWIEEEPIKSVLNVIPHKKGDIALPRVHFPEPAFAQARRLGIGRPVTNSFSRYIDQIRYAARNRLCIEIEYHGVKRLVEPYSLRQPRTGSQVLYVYELIRRGVNTNQIKSYKINEIANAEVKQQAFLPRYVVEL